MKPNYETLRLTILMQTVQLRLKDTDSGLNWKQIIFKLKSPLILSIYRMDIRIE